VFTGIGYDVVAGEEIRHPLWNWNAIAGRPLRAENSEVLLAQGLGKLLGCRAGSSGRFITGQGGYDAQERAFDCKSKKLQLQSATLRGQANSLDVEVVGLVDAMFREVDLRFSYLPLSLAQRLLDTNGVSYYSVRLRAGSDVAAYVNRLNAALLAKGLPLEASPWQADIIGEFYKKTMNFLHVFRNFMVIVILGVALFSIFNTFLRNVQDRTREIGVLRTLGFRVQEIRILFLLETLYLTGLGILMGSGAALLGAAILNRLTILYKIGLLTQPIPLLVLFSPWVLLVTILVVGVVTLGAVTIPLYQSERRKITDSLSYS
jgi:putative ABC transport system permease protein